MAVSANVAYTERTTENVVKCLTQVFPATIATAIVYEGAVDMIRGGFGCQRRTAEKLLWQAFFDGQLYTLEFLYGALTRVRRGDGTVVEVQGSPHFISEGWQNSLRHDDDPEMEPLRIGTGRGIAVALPAIFDPWLTEYGQRVPQISEVDALKDMVQRIATWQETHDDPDDAGTFPELVERAEALTDLCNWLQANPRPSVEEFLKGQGLT